MFFPLGEPNPAKEMVGRLLTRLSTWLQWRANLRAWRRRLRGCRKLARCWAVVEANPDVRAGYFSVEGEIRNVQQLYDENITHQSWYASLREDIDKGWTELARITLYYLVADRPMDKFVVRYYVSTLDHRLLGVVSDRQYGF
jgi:hypothetical protein